MQRRLTYANVMSTVAVFIALGGTSVAAVQLGKNSVKARHVARNAIDSNKVKDRSLLAKDFKRGQLPAGATGPAGPVGAAGPVGPVGPKGAFTSTTNEVKLSTFTTADGSEDGIPFPGAVLEQRANTMQWHQIEYDLTYPAACASDNDEMSFRIVDADFHTFGDDEVNWTPDKAGTKVHVRSNFAFDQLVPSTSPRSTPLLYTARDDCDEGDFVIENMVLRSLNFG